MSISFNIRSNSWHLENSYKYFSFHLFPGKHRVSVNEILDVVFEFSKSKSRTPIDQSERVSENRKHNIYQSDSTAENTAHHLSESDHAPEGTQNYTNDAAFEMEASNAGKWNSLK